MTEETEERKELNDTGCSAWFHVVGTSQYLGTAKMHRFMDCHQLRKNRYWHGTDDIVPTTVIPHESQKCKICERRFIKQNLADLPALAASALLCESST